MRLRQMQMKTCCNHTPLLFFLLKMSKMFVCLFVVGVLGVFVCLFVFVFVCLFCFGFIYLFKKNCFGGRFDYALCGKQTKSTNRLQGKILM